MEATDRSEATMNSRRIVGKLVDFLINNPAMLASAILAALMFFFVPHFATLQNIVTVSQQMSVYGIAVVGLAFVLICGGNDLSIAANITFASIAAALVMTRIYPQGGAVTGVAAAVLVGCLVGVANGFLVAKVGINPFMMTLIMSMLLEGLGILVTDAAAIGGLPGSYIAIGNSSVIGVPLPIFIVLAFFVFGQFILKKTVFGRKIYAVGGNKKAAQLAGIPADRMLIATYVFCGFCAAVSGVVLSSRLFAATPSPGTYMMLDIISAAIIGGNSLFGGKGSVVGAAFGVILLSLISNGLNLLGVNYNMTMIAKGMVILFAVVLDAYKGKFALMRMTRASAK